MDQQVIDRVVQQVEEKMKAGREVWESPEVQEKVENLRDVIRRYVQEYPVATIAGSVAAGYILARILRSGRSRKKRDE